MNMSLQAGQNQAQPIKMYGITPPISTAAPTTKENTLNDQLIQELKNQGTFESAAATAKREETLNILQKLAQEFVYKVSLAKNMTEGMARDAGGKVYTFGSYKLGVHSPGSDIDTLLVVPKHVTKNDFFTVFDELLRERPELEEIVPVPDAYVPIIKIEFNGIAVDLICARLDIPQVPLDLNLNDNNLLRNIDDPNARALNGTRVADQILELVPRPIVFKHALRCIKLWAKRKAVYGNIFGFPGGVAWALLVARICQLYPNAVSAVIISRFFYILRQWRWPEPVLLKKIEDGPLRLNIWNPQRNPKDRKHLMPVITPAYPSMCATHNITRSTQKVIIGEFDKGYNLMNGIMSGQNTWSELFKKHDFFHRYKFYLTIIVATRSNAEVHSKWKGMVESKVRLLVQKLEVVEGVDLAHPFVEPIEKSFYVSNEEVGPFLENVGTLKCEQEFKDKIIEINEISTKENNALEIPKNELHVMGLYIGLVINLKNQQDKKIDLQEPCQDFYRICREWSEYDENIHSISIKHVKLYDLPNYVYEEGEVRPTREKKRKSDKKNIARKRPRSANSVTNLTELQNEGTENSIGTKETTKTTTAATTTTSNPATSTTATSAAAPVASS
ncbi:hypothetical protein PACTADRAFT_18518 [Pachysolen tannophilus NRRL Y-2460]|uniref:Poly(A) polymerase n=1 Tax=Pachysolen tannophilus NRRL Y-2460 TaxID=669874 RepID=A0A1E4TQ61_PACTA|nr:hypothetical protein PACTADRAFT_18518 [Pachysolen tannophilus NRRL Y-2460]